MVAGHHPRLPLLTADCACLRVAAQAPAVKLGRRRSTKGPDQAEASGFLTHAAQHMERATVISMQTYHQQIFTSTCHQELHEARWRSHHAHPAQKIYMTSLKLLRTLLVRKEDLVMLTVAPSVTYRPPVWQRRLSVHTLLSQVLPVMDTLQRWSRFGMTSRHAHKAELDGA